MSMSSGRRLLKKRAILRVSCGSSSSCEMSTSKSPMLGSASTAARRSASAEAARSFFSFGIRVVRDSDDQRVAGRRTHACVAWRATNASIRRCWSSAETSVSSIESPPISSLRLLLGRRDSQPARV